MTCLQCGEQTKAYPCQACGYNLLLSLAPLDAQTLGAAVTQDSPTAREAELERQLNDMTARKDNLSQEVKRLNADCKALRGQFRNLEGRLGRLRAVWGLWLAAGLVLIYAGVYLLGSFLLEIVMCSDIIVEWNEIHRVWTTFGFISAVGCIVLGIVVTVFAYTRREEYYDLPAMR